MNCNDSMINNSILKKRDDPGRNFQILAISNRHLCNQPFEDQIKRVCEWHPDALILREKDLPEDEYKALAKNILDICKTYDVPCILHTYWKAALELGHDAIHLPLPLLRELSAESQKHLQSSRPFWTLPRRVKAMMKSSELVAKVVDIAKHYKTLYVMGCFGAPLTDTNKSRYIKNHPYNMAAARTSMIMAATPDTFGFDCVNLIKAVLWGWTGDKTKSYGGAKYATNGVPDEGADTMIKRCKDATASGWDKVDPGEVVWTTGHIGVYIGNGLAVECSPRWANNVQITAVGNIGKKNGYNTRMWKKHGHLPYVIYDKTVTPAQPEMVKPVPTTEVKAKGVARSFNKAVAGTYTVTAGAGLNVRDAAGTDSRVLVTIPKGTTVKNYGYYTVVNGVKWLYVAFSHKRVNYTGFVHERFLSR